MKKRTEMPPRRAWIRRSSTHTAGSPLRSPRTPRKGRSPKEATRIYGGRERIQWIKARPCVVPRCQNQPCENAHVQTGGMGRKADARFVVPLCRSHHQRLHLIGTDTFEDRFGLNLGQLAAATQAAWLTYTGVAA